MSADESITSLPEAVKEYGAFPVPVLVEHEPRTLDVVEHELTGARLSLYEEELETARLRLALKSAQRGRLQARETVRQMVDALNGHDCPPPGESPMEAATRFAVRLMEAERLLAELESLELGDLDGRVSASCGKPNHLTWLRKLDDTRACPWCVMELQNDSLVARTHQLANYQEIERNFWANQRADESLAAVANRRIAELNARIAELESERHSTNEALSDAAVRMRADRDRIVALEAALADFTEPDVDGAGRTYESYYPERSVKAAVFSPVASLREPEGEFHGLLHHDYRVGHDLPETGGTR